MTIIWSETQVQVESTQVLVKIDVMKCYSGKKNNIPQKSVIWRLSSICTSWNAAGRSNQSEAAGRGHGGTHELSNRLVSSSLSALTHTHQHTNIDTLTRGSTAVVRTAWRGRKAEAETTQRRRTVSFCPEMWENLPTSVTHLQRGASCVGQDQHGGLLWRFSLLPGRPNRRAAARLTNTKLVLSIFAWPTSTTLRFVLRTTAAQALELVVPGWWRTGGAGSR